MPGLQNIDNDSQFKSILEKPTLSVIHFWADWAPQCEQMNDVMTVLADDLPSVGFWKIEAESFPQIALDHKVNAVPTFLLVRHGKVAERIEGASPANLTKAVNKLAQDPDIGAPLPLAKPPPRKEMSLDERLKKLVSASPCMLFMKGSPDEPKCGFSRQTIEILKSLDAAFGHFDILSDEEVRQGLKKFSNWPTYPQLYVNGELIGGLDIIKEMVESGDLQEMLPKKKNLEERLKGLINEAPLMVFMKGNRDTPKCGFSRQLMEILQDLNLDFKTFDILEDNDVRQGLKTFSNWPTYPQVYVKGDLVGGLDIIKELREAGELEATLKGE